MSPPASILVCRLSALGDVVLALPVVDALRERYPNARLEFLSRDPFGRILSGVRAIDRLHLWAGTGHPRPEGIADRRWDLVVDLSGSGRSRNLLAGVRAARRLRVRKQSLRRFAFVKLRAWGGASVDLASALDRMFDTLSPLGLTRDGRVPRFDVSAPPTDGPWLIAPGAGRDTKRWPAERFRELTSRVAQRERRVVILGSEDERALLERVAHGVAPDRCEIIAGPDPGELPGIAARCPVALANDSGVLHVAEACGARVVALFGPTHPRLGFAPLGAESVALHAGVRCSPCDLHGPRICPKGHHRCMADISVERVSRELGLAETAEVGP